MIFSQTQSYRYFKRLHEHLPLFTPSYGLHVRLQATLPTQEQLKAITPCSPYKITSSAPCTITHDYTSIPEESLLLFTTNWVPKQTREDQLYGIDTIDCIHYLYANDVVHILVPEHAQLTLHLSKIVEQFHFSHVFIHIKPHAHCTIQFHNTTTSTGCSYDSIRIFQEEGSTCIFSGFTTHQSDLACFSRILVKQQANTTCTIATADTTTHYFQSLIMSSLEGPHSSFVVKQIPLINTPHAQYDAYLAAYHQASHSSSDLTTRGICLDTSKTLVRGLIHIAPDAHDCQGYEQQDLLTASPKTKAFAIPNLEINNHIVQCSHGSAIAQVDPLQLHYLMSRGIPHTDALELILQGYCLHILDNKSDTFLKAQLPLFIKRCLQF